MAGFRIKVGYMVNDKRRPPKGLIIREARKQDIEQLAELNHKRYGGKLPEIIEGFEREIAGLYETDEHLLIVAEYENKLVGFARAKSFEPPPTAPPNICPEGWYLTGIIVASEYRRKGIASALTKERLNWIAKRSERAYYFANAQNKVSIDMHKQFVFTEISRNFVYPDVSFEGGEGILFKADLQKSDRL